MNKKTVKETQFEDFMKRLIRVKPEEVKAEEKKDKKKEDKKAKPQSNKNS